MGDIVEIGRIKDRDDFKELERQAYNNTIDISNFQPAEYKYFDRLREISHEYRVKGMTEEARAELNRKKDLIYKEYEEEADERARRALRYQALILGIQRSEFIRTEILKTNDKDKQLDLAMQCISLMMLDGDCFYRMVKKRWEENVQVTD